MKTLWCAASVGVLAAVISGPAAASGFYVQEQSARAVGRAFSGEGADTGSASLWWNPAAIGGVAGRGDVQLGVHHVAVDATVSDTGSTIRRIPAGLPSLPVGGVSPQEDPIDKGVVPNFGASWRLNDKWVLGFGVAAPFNFATRYPVTSFTRYQALKSYVFNVDLQPTLAWRPVPQLDVAVGLDANFTRATLSNALPNLSPLLPDGGQVLQGKGWDYGWVAGLQFHPNDQFTLGLSYRDGIKHKLAGVATISGLLGPAAAANTVAAATARFSTPAIFTVSGRLKATDKLTLNGQIQHLTWSSFDAIVVDLPGRTSSTPQSYDNVTSIAVGADYAVTPQWTLRAGVQRDPTPTPDPGRTARVPDGDRWDFAAGASFAASERVTLDLSALYISFKDSPINSAADAFGGTALNTPVNILGGVHGKGLVLSAGLRMSF